MNTEDFIRSIHGLHARLLELSKTKGEEYKRRDDNQFANFERGARALGLTREQVLMVYLSKHLDSITTYVRDRAAGEHQEYAEPITGRIDDAILYLLLLRGMAVQNGEEYGRAIADAVIGAEEPSPAPEEAAPTQGAMVVGGVTTAPRAVPLAGLSGVSWDTREVYVISTRQDDASNMCRRLGLPVAARALSTADQLHGVAPRGHVVVVSRGTAADGVLLIEVKERCAKNHMTYEVCSP